MDIKQNKQKIIAVIDIGSNAIRLQVSRIEDKSQKKYSSICFLRIPLRLGDDSFKLNKISPQLAKKIVKIIESFLIICDVLSVEKIIAVATNALRQAENSKEIINQIKNQTKIDIKLISETKEAKLTSISTMKYVKNEKSYLHFDLGGGSTEFSICKSSKVLKSKSFKIGTLRLLRSKISKNSWDDLSVWLLKASKEYRFNDVYATGGGINILYYLIYNREDQKYSKIKFILKEDLISYKKTIKNQTIHQIINSQNITLTQVDVVRETIKIVNYIMNSTKKEKVNILSSGLIDGLIIDYITNYI